MTKVFYIKTSAYIYTMNYFYNFIIDDTVIRDQ